MRDARMIGIAELARASATATSTVDASCRHVNSIRIPSSASHAGVDQSAITYSAPMPSAHPAAPPTSPYSADSRNSTALVCRRVAPMLRNVPITGSRSVVIT